MVMNALAGEPAGTTCGIMLLRAIVMVSGPSGLRSSFTLLLMSIESMIFI